MVEDGGNSPGWWVRGGCVRVWEWVCEGLDVGGLVIGDGLGNHGSLVDGGRAAGWRGNGCGLAEEWTLVGGGVAVGGRVAGRC